MEPRVTRAITEIESCPESLAEESLILSSYMGKTFFLEGVLVFEVRDGRETLDIDAIVATPTLHALIIVML